MKLFTTLTLLLFSICAVSQDLESPKVDSTRWEKKNTLGFDVSEIAFVNWNAGGVSSVSGLLKGDFVRRLTLSKSKWGNELTVRYGINKQDGVEWRKTDDVFKFDSNFGYRRDTTSFWYHSARFSFATQFTEGFAYPNTERSISKPFAPAYIFLGAGAEYSNKPKRVNFYFSPLTMKTTLVLDERLANQGAFGVRPARFDPVTGEMTSSGSRSRTEHGILSTSHVKWDVYKNMAVENKLSLYTDYINNFGNIDVDWQFNLNFIVNEYVRANIGIHIIYDDDIKAKEEIDGEQVIVGPKVQLKQTLGIGVTYSF